MPIINNLKCTESRRGIFLAPKNFASKLLEDDLSNFHKNFKVDITREELKYVIDGIYWENSLIGVKPPHNILMHYIKDN